MALSVATLEESFDLVAPQGDELMRRFYDRLFEAAPSVKPLFANVDMQRQRVAPRSGGHRPGSRGSR